MTSSSSPPAQGRLNADRALLTLRRAIEGGFRNLDQMRQDADLASLRDRDDFRLLVMDLAMPANPFAHRPDPAPA